MDTTSCKQYILKFLVLMIELFDDILRTNDQPSNHNVNEYDYMNKSSRDIIVQARENLSIWFRDYPKEEKKELKMRFKKDFASAFFELYLYTSFKKQGFSIQIHPAVPNSNKKPDFLISKDTLEIYLEAKTVSNKSEKEKAEERKINQLFDEISKSNFNNTILLLEELKLKNNKQPSASKIKKEIISHISSFDLEDISRKFESGEISNPPKIIIDNEDIFLEIGLFSIKNDKNNLDKNRPIGSYPFKTLESGEEILKKSVNKKAKRYGELDKPFIVCLNTLDYETSNTFSIYNAVWGSEAITYSLDPKNRNHRRIRKPDGIFYNKRPRLKNLSGILITNVNPYNLNIVEQFLFKHPFSENELDFDKLGFQYEYLNKTQLEKKDGVELKNIFD